jgi:hypothetical protein
VPAETRPGGAGECGTLVAMALLERDSALAALAEYGQQARSG